MIRSYAILAMPFLVCGFGLIGFCKSEGAEAEISLGSPHT